jgi:UDP-N-acetylmuramyl tripeptide synthase
MITAGIVGNSDIAQTASLINSILSSKGKKVSSIDYKNLSDLGANQVKLYLNELKKNGVDVLLLKINQTDIENDFIRGIDLDAVIFPAKKAEADNSSENSQKTLKLFSLLGERGIIIANEDDPDLINFLEGTHRPVITYGFNSKASITTSSVGDMMSDSRLMCCLQKPILARDGILIGPHEYRVEIESGEFDAYDVLAATTFAIINGVDL